MNHSEKIILIAVTIFFVGIFSVSLVHAQTLTFSYSNSTQTFITPVVNSTLSTTPDPCVRSAELQIHAITSSFNIKKATSLANGNIEFKSRIGEYNPVFDSNFDTWNLNKTSCTITWKTSNVVYDLYNSTGGNVKRVVVTEDPSSTRILNITEQHQTGQFSVVAPSSSWSGFEFAGDGNIPPSTKMYNSYSTFTIPSVSIPTYPNNACRTDLGNLPCVLVTWVGLEDTAGADDNKLAQTGAAGNITCSSPTSCTTKYSIWYEFLRANPIYCTSLGQVKSGDSITADIYNDTIVNGNTHPNRIDILTIDNTNPNANACSISRDSYFTTTPIYSSFINESPIWATLPQFNNVQMTQNTVYYGNSYRYISQPYSNGWTNETDYFNSADTSITNHDPIGQNFTESWNPLCSPTSGTWTVSSTCTLGSNFQTSGNVIVPNGVVLRIPWGQTLRIDFSHYNLQVNSGGGVLIDGSGDNPIQSGGAIKCPTC